MAEGFSQYVRALDGMCRMRINNRWLGWLADPYASKMHNIFVFDAGAYESNAIKKPDSTTHTHTGRQKSV